MILRLMILKLKITIIAVEFTRGGSMIEMIVTAGICREIGKDNKLLWNLKDDMKHFVNVTKGKNVVMGRKTFDSFPNRPLKGRNNYVLSNSQEAFGQMIIQA